MTTVSSTSSLTDIMNTIDLGTTSSIQMMFAKLQLAQSEICKAQATDYMNQIEEIQEEQKKCAEMIEQARTLQEQAKTTGKTTTMPTEMVNYFTEHGLSWDTDGNDYKHYADQWDYNIKSLTNYQETIGNKTQTLMVYLQDFVSQYNSYLQGASTQISNANQTLTNIARGQ